MKKFLILIPMVLVSSAVFAGGFTDCYEKANLTMGNSDAVRACAGAGVGFKDCYAKANQTMANSESAIVCSGAGLDFRECYSKANQTMSNSEAVKACAVRSCN